ncbi:hypothetical protein RCL1_002646 [Eukaryota sp. TZLM3-RCL]
MISPEVLEENSYTFADVALVLSENLNIGLKFPDVDEPVMLETSKNKTYLITSPLPEALSKSFLSLFVRKRTFVLFLLGAPDCLLARYRR